MLNNKATPMPANAKNIRKVYDGLEERSRLITSRFRFLNTGDVRNVGWLPANRLASA